MATPASSAASTTSRSRCDPPGWMIARTPASLAAWGPSANGKNASEASAAPSSDRPAAAALSIAIRTESTRQHDRIRAHVLAHSHREEQLAPLLLRRLPCGRDAHQLAVLHPRVPVLHEDAAADAL